MHIRRISRSSRRRLSRKAKTRISFERPPMAQAFHGALSLTGGYVAGQRHAAQQPAPRVRIEEYSSGRVSPFAHQRGPAHDRTGTYVTGSDAGSSPRAGPEEVANRHFASSRCGKSVRKCAPRDSVRVSAAVAIRWQTVSMF